MMAGTQKMKIFERSGLILSEYLSARTRRNGPLTKVTMMLLNTLEILEVSLVILVMSEEILSLSMFSNEKS